MAININLGIFAVAGGTADVITAAYTPTTSSLYNGLYKQFRAIGANTVVAPTLNVDGLGAKAIVKKGGNALVVGDIAGAGHVCEVSYNSTTQKWELLNPANDETDSIFEENSGIITPITLANILRLGGGNTNWGLSPLEIYSEEGMFPFLIGDIATLNYLWLINDSANSFTLTIGGVLVFTGEVRADTPAAGDNSTKVATTAYSDRVNVQSVASAATVTPVAANDLVVITAQAEALTLANPTGTWQQGQALAIRIKDNGTSRSIGYGAKFRALGTTLPTATTISKTIYLFVIYNSTDDTFDVTGVSEQA